MAAIRTEGLTKYYGETRGIEDLTFTVEEGEVFGFLGPNGAGKTTAIRTLLGLQAPTSGSAWLLGHDVTDERALLQAKANVGYLPSDPGLDEGATGQRLIDYFASLRGDERSEELLELFDPPLARKVGEYSRGNKQMLAIVLAFMHDPDLVLMDEPTSGLDPLKQELFADFVRSEVADGKTFFFSSHILSEVQKVCDRVGIIRSGRLVELESVETLLARGGKVVRLRVRDPVGPESFALDGVHDLSVGTGDPGGPGESAESSAEDAGGVDGGESREGTAVAFTYTGNYNDLLAHLTAFDVVGIDVEEAPLEDVFMRFYGETGNGEADGDGAEGESESVHGEAA